MVFSKLKFVRMTKGIKQAKAAKAIGISRTYLSQIENKTLPTTMEILIKLAKLYEVDPKELI